MFFGLGFRNFVFSTSGSWSVKWWITGLDLPLKPKLKDPKPPKALKPSTQDNLWGYGSFGFGSLKRKLHSWAWASVSLLKFEG